MKHKNYDVIVAWAAGQTIQIRYGTIWHDVLNKIDTPNFNDEKAEWRVKPEPTILTYRIALMRASIDNDYDNSKINYYAAIFNNSETFLVPFMNSENFVKWVSEWLELEVPE